MGKKDLKDLDSKNSRKRQTKTTLNGDPVGWPNFCW